MSEARCIREPVPGAPYQPGDRVMVVCQEDDTANHRRLAQVGTVDCLWYDGGCGEEYPYSPLIGVRFGRAQRRIDRAPEGIDEFWPEELEAAS